MRKLWRNKWRWRHKNRRPRHSAVPIPTTLIRLAIPNTSIRRGPNIARDFHQSHRNTRLIIQRSKSRPNHLRRTSWSDTSIETSQAVFPTRPLSDDKYACLGVVRCFGDVFAVFGGVEPLFAVLASVGLAVDIFDAEADSWIDICDCRAFFIQAELNFPNCWVRFSLDAV